MGTKHDLAGRRFGRWLVSNRAADKGGQPYWNCLCDCGTSKAVYASSLTRGLSVSCGCFNKEGTSARCLSHGHSNGGNGTRTYNCWRNMKARCHNKSSPKYPIYGARGIKVCDRWQEFANFLSDMGECPSDGHSIDRIDNDGNYEPVNCRWATVVEQMNNQSTNRLLEFNGKTQTLAQWSREVGIKAITIHRRLKLIGWSLERALTEPVQFGPRSIRVD